MEYNDLLEIYDINNFNLSDLDILLHEVLKHIRNLLNAESGVIYLKENNYLRFRVFQNDEMSYENIYRQYHEFKNSYIPLDTDIDYISVKCFNSKNVIYVNDIYLNNEFSFNSIKKFDQKFGYKSKSILIIPLINPSTKKNIGVIQLINKKSNGKFLDFNSKDKETVSIVNSFITLSIVKALENDLKNSNKPNTFVVQSEDINSQNERFIEAFHNMNDDSIKNVLSSVAHRWRQPLSSISTIASGLSIELDLKNNVDENIVSQLRKIVLTTQNLSNVIDDFRNLYNDLPKEEFFITNMFEKVLSLHEIVLNENKIKVTNNLNESIVVFGLKNQFIQILINIMTNVQENFTSNHKMRREKLMFLDSRRKENKYIVELRDNSLSDLDDKINNENVEIFEISLFIAKLIIQKHFLGNIEKEFIQFKYKNEVQDGYLYKIEIPIL